MATITFLSSAKTKFESQSLIDDLVAKGFDILTIKFNPEKIECDNKKEIDDAITQSEKIVIILNKEIVHHLCVTYAIDTANRGNKEIIIIMEEDVISELGDEFSYGVDTVIPTSDDLAEEISQASGEWKNFNNEKIDKRKIKKHTCG